MKKKSFFAVLATVAVLSGTFGFINSNTKTSSEITLATVEAEAGWIEDYWDREDYNCISVTCQCVFYSYRGEVSEYVGAGNGTVAHQWSCSGCGDCGWTM